MKLRPVTGAMLVAAILLAILLNIRRREEPERPGSPPLPETPAFPIAPFITDLPEPHEDRSSRHLKSYASPSTSPQEDLAEVWTLLESFNNTIKHRGSLPMGSNREITTLLLGKNPRQLRFLDPAKPYLNQRGELLDRWGTPLFFHLVEEGEIAIRSAGEDRKLWTQDDLTFGEFADQLE